VSCFMTLTQQDEVCPSMRCALQICERAKLVVLTIFVMFLFLCSKHLQECSAGPWKHL